MILLDDEAGDENKNAEADCKNPCSNKMKSVYTFWAAAPKGRCPVGHRGKYGGIHYRKTNLLIQEDKFTDILNID